MTLIIGIKCSDGIVMGADGAATLGAMGQCTIRQAKKKLDIIKEKVIVGTSGPVGLGQRIRGEIEILWEKKEFSGSKIRKPFDAMTVIRNKMWEHVGPELNAAGIARPALGDIASLDVLCFTLVALPVLGKPCLFQFDQQCAPEEATDDLPFVAIGSGRLIADPFLAFLRRIFWSNNQPTVADGIFATYWTLDHAIRTHPGGVADPKQIVILERKDTDWEARELLDDQLSEHAEAITEAENSLAGFREALRRRGEVKPPKP